MKTAYKLRNSIAQCDPNAPVQKDKSDWLVKKPICDHDWQPDGQTMTAVRLTCTKCHKTLLNGLEI